LGILFDAVTGKPVSTACLLIEFDLPPNAVVERQKTICLHLRKIHHVNLAAEREAYLNELISSESTSQKSAQGRGKATLPLPKHSLHGAGNILRPGSIGCLTFGSPVPPQAGHFISVTRRIGIFMKSAF
jgi:hypothetical protein